MDKLSKTVYVFGLLMSCPLGRPRPDCPLEKYRKGSAKDRYKVFESFSDQDLDKIISHHKDCLARIS